MNTRLALLFVSASCALGCATEIADPPDAAAQIDAGFDQLDAAPEPDAAEPAGRFWHLETPADSERSWLVDPDGNRVFVLAVNTVMRDTRRDGSPRCEGIADFIGRLAPTRTAHIEWARLTDGASGGETVPSPYHFNSVGSFSDINDFDDSGGRSYMVRAVEDGGAGAPYSVVMSPATSDDAYVLRDAGGTILRTGITQSKVGDPYNPAYRADLDARFAERVAPYRDDPRLQMWYLGNEAGIFDKGGKGNEGVRDFRRWIWSQCPGASSIDAPQCARHAAAAFLRDRYGGDVGALNDAWDASYASFAAIVDDGPRPIPYEQSCNLACREDLQRFVHDGLLREWVRLVTTRLRAADPNHLVATPRLALGNASVFRFFDGASSADPDIWVDSGNRVGTSTAAVDYTPYDLLARDGDAGFDLIAVNVYTGSPTFARPWFTDGIHKMQNESGLPVFVSEFSVRARIDGWSNRGGAGAFVPSADGVSDQLQRGQRYRSQIEQLVAFRHIVGASWHAWSDRYMPDNPAVQINMGLVRCRDPARGHEPGERWDLIDDEIAATNRDILELIEAATGL